VAKKPKPRILPFPVKPKPEGGLQIEIAVSVKQPWKHQP
jgi:hypothetical protein